MIVYVLSDIDYQWSPTLSVSLDEGTVIRKLVEIHSSYLTSPDVECDGCSTVEVWDTDKNELIRRDDYVCLTPAKSKPDWHKLIHAGVANSLYKWVGGE